VDEQHQRVHQGGAQQRGHQLAAADPARSGPGHDYLAHTSPFQEASSAANTMIGQAPALGSGQNTTG